MANFEPRWSLEADKEKLKEGQSTYFYVRLSRDKIEENVSSQYLIEDNQYLEIVLDISGEGETLEERDFDVKVGESKTSLVPITSIPPYKLLAQHTIELSKKDFVLGSDGTLNAYFLNIAIPIDGIWDNSESLRVEMKSVTLFTVTDGQISDQIASGSLGNTVKTLVFDSSDEVWLTPDLVVHGDELYTIGEISYGSESRLFVQAFGASKTISGVKNVFVPAYELMTMTEAEMPSQHKTGKGTVLNPDPDVDSKTKEIPVLVTDSAGVVVESGMKFDSNNGQFVQTCLYESEPVDAYAKIRIQSVRTQYTKPEDAYYLNKRFRAYETWICPADTSSMFGSPKPGHLYQLKDTTVYPYVVQEESRQGIKKLAFDESKWYDLGVYNETLGAAFINKTRIFRIVMNDGTSTDITFETDSNLGEVHVGEYFGHSTYPVIKATGSDLITYEIDHKTSPDDILKYNIDLTADGYIIGTAYARSVDFSANDDISLEFDVVATAKTGNTVKQRFKLKIVRGFGNDFLSAFANPSINFERAWFAMIASNSYAGTSYYRQSDPRYGLQKVPRILLKENCVDPLADHTDLNSTIAKLRAGIIDVQHGAPTPSSSFNVTMGNYKVRSAIDDMGNILYDLLYREIHPQGTQVDLSLKPFEYTDYNDTVIAEIYGLRQNIYNVVGEDTVNLLTDPTDLQNRGIVVDAINGLSVQMLDTVPRYMNHPYIQSDDLQKAMYFPCIPVAYLPPSQGEVFFNTLVQNNEHSTLLNRDLEIGSVEFIFFAQDNARYVPDNFTATLKMPLLSE